MVGPSFREAKSVVEACPLIGVAPADTRVVSGGTALTLMRRLGLLDAECLVSAARPGRYCPSRRRSPSTASASAFLRPGGHPCRPRSPQ